MVLPCLTSLRYNAFIRPFTKCLQESTAIIYPNYGIFMKILIDGVYANTNNVSLIEDDYNGIFDGIIFIQ